jgi:hypothetical protein
VLELFYGISGTSDGIAHTAHLGGALVGFLYMLGTRGRLPVAEIFARFRPRGIPRGPLPPGMRGTGEVQDARFYDIRGGRSVPETPEINQEVVDEILDKISTSGYQSLSEEEKRVLHEASKHLN